MDDKLIHPTVADVNVQPVPTQPTPVTSQAYPTYTDPAPVAQAVPVAPAPAPTPVVESLEAPAAAPIPQPQAATPVALDVNPIPQQFTPSLAGAGVAPSVSVPPKRKWELPGSTRLLAVFGVFAILMLGATLLFHKGQQPITNSQNNQVIPEQDLTAGAGIQDNNFGTQEEAKTLIVNGDVRLQGSLNFNSGAFLGGIVQGTLSGNRTYTLPDSSGEFCLSSNNCGYLTAASLTQLQTDVSGLQAQTQTNGQNLTAGTGIDIVGSAIQNTGVLTLNGQDGAVSLTGGSGILVSGTIITNSGVLSLGGQSGALNLVSGPGISVSGLTISNNGVTSVQGLTGNVVFTAGTGIDITGTAVSNTGVTLLTGTANQVSVSGGTGSVTLSLPQDIAVASSPTFAGVTATTLTATTVTSSTGLTVGATNKTLTLQGSTTQLTATNAGNTATLTFVNPTSNVVYRFTTAAAGTYDVCTTTGNCSGVGGGVTTSGGTNGVIPKFTSSQGIGNSNISDSGSMVTIGSDLTVTGIINGQIVSPDAHFTGNVTVDLDLNVTGALHVNSIAPTGAMTVGSSGQNLLLQGSAVTISSTNSGITNSLVFATPSGSNKTITLPNVSGTVCLTSGNCAGVGGTGDILQNGNSFAAAMTIGTNDNNPLNFETNNAIAMTILANGKVGIANTNPLNTLDVIGTFGVTGTLGSISTSTTGNNLDFSRPGSNYITATNASAGLSLGAGGVAGVLAIANNNAASTLNINGSKVGIGATGPGNLLHIKASGNSFTNSGIRLEDDATTNYYDVIFDDRYRVGYNGSTLLSLSTTGDLGVGGSGASAKLHVQGGNALLDNTYGFQIRNNAATAISAVKLDASNNLTVGATSGMANLTLTAGTGSIALTTSSVTAMTILNGGNVGIGQANPAAKLQVESTSAGTTVLLVKGTTSQSGNLQEWQFSDGTVRAFVDPTGSLGARNLIVGGTAAGGNSVVFARNAGTQSWQWYSPDDANLYLRDLVNSRMLLTAIPSATNPVLQVSGRQEINVQSISSTGLIVKGASGQTADLIQAQTNGGSVIFSVGPANGPGATYGVTAANTLITSGAVGTVGLQVKGAASQSANLQEWQDSLGTVLSRVKTDGGYGFTAGTTDVVFRSPVTNWAAITSNNSNNGIWFNGTSSLIAKSVGTAYLQSGDGAYSLTLGPTGVHSLNGQLTLSSPSASWIPNIVKGFASQSADLTQWQDSTGTVLAKVMSDGSIASSTFKPLSGNAQLTLGSTSTFGNSSVQIGSGYELRLGTAIANTTLTVNTAAANYAGIIVKGSASQTANLQEWQDSTGAVRASIDKNGMAVWNYPTATITTGIQLKTAGTTVWQVNTDGGSQQSGTIYTSTASAASGVTRLAVGGTALNSNLASFITDSAGVIPIIARGATSQSANLQEWQDSTGTILARVSASGQVITNNIGAQSNSFVAFNSGVLPDADGVRNLGSDGRRWNQIRAQDGKLWASAAGVNPLLIFGAASQTADLQQWQTSAGTILTAIQSDGKLVFGPSGSQDTNLYRSAADTLKTDDNFVIGTGRGLNLNGIDILNDGASTLRVYGGLTVNNNAKIIGTLGIGVDATSAQEILVQNASASTVGIVVKGAASQTANLQDWRDSTNSVLTSIGADGSLQFQGGGAGLTPRLNRVDSGVISLSGNSSYSYLYFNLNSTYKAFLGYNATGNTLTLQNDQTGPLILGAGGYERMRLNSFGQVGIGGTASTEWLLVNNGDAAQKALTVRGAASQTADLQQWQNSAGSIVAKMTPTGTLWVEALQGVAQSSYIYMNDTNYGAIAVNTNAALKAFAVRGAASQTADLQQWQNSATTVLTRIDAAGNIGVGTAPVATVFTSTFAGVTMGGGPNAVVFNRSGQFNLFDDGGRWQAGWESLGAQKGLVSRSDGRWAIGADANTVASQLFVNNILSASNSALVVRGFASQTADLQQWQNNSGSTLAAISKDGYLSVGVATGQKTITIPASTIGSATSVGTSTASTATAYSNQKRAVTLSTGRMVAVYADTSTNAKFKYSDDGTTWTDYAADIAGWADGSITTYVDSGGTERIVALWKQTGTGGGRTDLSPYLMVGTFNSARTTITWGTPTRDSIGDSRFDYGDVVAIPEGTGAKIHVILSFVIVSGGTNNEVDVYRFGVDSSGVLGASSEGVTTVGPAYGVAVHTWPSIAYNPSTKDIYAAWSAGTTGTGKGIRFKKATYSAGSWTWGSEIDVDTNWYVPSINGPSLSVRWDANRAKVIIGGLWLSGGSTYSWRLDESSDFVNFNNIASSGSETLDNSTFSIDPTNGDIYAFGQNSAYTDFGYRKWTRSSTILSSFTSLDTSVTGGARYAYNWYSSNVIRLLYTSGSGSPYTVKYNSYTIATTGLDTTSKIVVNGNVEASSFTINGVNVSAGLSYWTQGTSGVYSNNSIGIGNTTPAYLLHVGSSSLASGTAVARFENAGGTCTVTPNTAGGISCTSDERLKKDITDYSGSLDKILALDAVQYHLLAESGSDSLHVGFLAQAFEGLFPDLTVTDKDGYKAISYAGLTPYLVQAIQEQQQMIQSLGSGNFSSMVVSGNMTIHGKLTVANAVVTGNLTVGGHILTNGNKPQAVKDVGLGQDQGVLAASVSVDGTDTAGTLSLVTGAAPTAGTLAKITFAQAYEKPPRIVVTATNEDGLSLPVYVRKVDGGFEIVTNTVPQAGKTYQFDYVIIGAQASN